MTITKGALATFFIGMWSMLPAQTFAPAGDTTQPTITSQPVPYVKVDWPETESRHRLHANAAATQATPAALTASTLFKQSVNLRLLVLSADGTEPSFGAIKFFLDYLGLPYDAVVLSTSGLTLPALTDATHGLYQGIVLTSGSLAYNGPNGWTSALSTADWTKMDDYQRNYGVRVVTYYSWPEARYGLALSGTTGYSTSPSAPANITITAGGKALFPYLNTANPVNMIYSYYYPATPVAAAGETTTPIMTITGNGVTNQTVAVTHVAADGRESLTMTFDNSQYLMHSLALNYGIFNWVTKGVFLGERKVYVNPQSDDFFLDGNLYTATPAACNPATISLDPTFDAGVPCPAQRDVAGDLSALANWQRGWQSKSQFRNFRLAHAFNGFGTTPDFGTPANDPLTTQAKLLRSDFYWLSHTWDHQNLDCYNPVPNSGICVAATYAEALAELQQNITFAQTLGLPNDTASMVTPAISGLRSLPFLQAAATAGIKYLVSDLSRPDWQPTAPNTGVRSPYVNSILYIPRRATNIFYNAVSGNNGALGSLPDEYNFFFGPNGILRIGGPGGPPFFTTNQTYAQIIDSESNTLLTYMMRGEMYPTMFHQLNLARYNGQKSLFSDLFDATFTKFAKLSTLPVSSIPQTTIGQLMEQRMSYLASNVKAVYVPQQGITLTASGAAKVPVTGVCSTGCAPYGGQNISTVSVSPAGSTFIPLY